MRETLTAIPSHRVAPEVDGFTSRPDCSAHLIVKIEPSDQKVEKEDLTLRLMPEVSWFYFINVFARDTCIHYRVYQLNVGIGPLHCMKCTNSHI